MSNKRPRLLKRNVDDDLQGAYEWSQEENVWMRPRRPMPSYNQLILSMAAGGAVAEADRELSPLLLSFLTAVGHPRGVTDNNQGVVGETKHASTTTTTTNEQENGGSMVVLAMMDDSNHSTLTLGQHQRYLKLVVSTNQRQSWTEVQWKEYKKLRPLVQAEQRLYHDAVVEYWETNKQRLLVGLSPMTQSLPAAKFVQLVTNLELWMQRIWRDRLKDTSYGKVCQVISLEPFHGNKPNSNTKSSTAVWMIDAIESQSVDVDSSDVIPRETSSEISSREFPKVGSKIPPYKAPQQQSPSLTSFLEEDPIALTIAKRHRVPIIATMEALEAMLDTADGTNQWILPVTLVDNIALVDSPLPRTFSNPRACLTQGLDQGLAHWSHLHHGDKKEDEEDDPDDGKTDHRFRYMILSVPQVSGSSSSSGSSKVKVKHTKVVVRLPRQSTRAHAQVEYFSEERKNAEEIASSLDRSLWILDHYLFSRSVVARIDPMSCRVLHWEETSVAHALATATLDNNRHDVVAFPSFTTSIAHTKSCLDHWHGLAQILQAIPTIGNNKGKYMLCMPGRGCPNNMSLSSLSRSVSVHMETTTTTTIGGEGALLDLEKDLVRAGEVKLGVEAIRSCIRPWVWKEEDRIPYTFPPKAEAPQRKFASKFDARYK
jgi:hypothetical protein